MIPGANLSQAFSTKHPLHLTSSGLILQEHWDPDPVRASLLIEREALSGYLGSVCVFGLAKHATPACLALEVNSCLNPVRNEFAEQHLERWENEGEGAVVGMMGENAGC